ncbi:oxidoreductase-like protein [Cadophora sp. MPI-SDFR-AT-0126]|nr:oxidoreductase-like protein [Leotiomycetes sp. MPI-SDFR-AT-0126]
MAISNGSTSGSTGQIPVIDISGSRPESEVAKQLVDAAATYGFVYVKNEGKDIPVDVIDDIFQLSKSFFKSPIEEKKSCTIQKNNRGWVGMHAETLDPKSQRMGDFKEAFNLAEFINGEPQQPLPPTFVPHEKQLDTFHKYCHSLMEKILVLFAIGIEVDPGKGGPDWFASRHRGGEESSCTLRLLYYPPIPPGTDYKPEVDIRAGAHSDYGSITLLFQRPGQPGLEIIPPSTSEVHSERNYSNTAAWTPVPVFPPGTENDPSPPILVNIGDLLSHWTNNLFKSTVHRVVFPNQGKEGGDDRYSIAYFGHPVGSTVLEPVPSKMVQELSGVNAGVSTGVHAMTADEHLMSRLKATYLGMYKDGKENEVSES